MIVTDDGPAVGLDAQEEQIAGAGASAAHEGKRPAGHLRPQCDPHAGAAEPGQLEIAVADRPQRMDGSAERGRPVAGANFSSQRGEGNDGRVPQRPAVVVQLQTQLAAVVAGIVRADADLQGVPSGAGSDDR